MFNPKHEPALMHDPELYAARFYGMMRAPLCDHDDYGEPTGWEDYKPNCPKCAGSGLQVYCQDCHKERCTLCSHQTGLADGYRCDGCEQLSLEKLERACKLIGSVAYQEELIDAMMKRIWM
jgi:hypothetical protein